MAGAGLEGKINVDISKVKKEFSVLVFADFSLACNICTTNCSLLCFVLFNDLYSISFIFAAFCHFRMKTSAAALDKLRLFDSYPVQSCKISHMFDI